VAICFVRAKVISRGSGGSATAAAGYRSGEKIKDRATGKTHDYTKKQGVDHSEILTPIAATEACASSNDDRNEWLTDRAELWNRVEASEKRSDAQLAREMIIAIPRELDREDQINLVREYVQTTFVDRGMIADINLHHLDGTNPHAHVMLTMRELKIGEQGIVSFGNKDRSWNDKKLLETQIKEWEVVANQYLDRAGFDTHIDSRSYEEQGISRIPQIHLGKNVTAMRRQGIPTERGDLYDQIEQANQDIRQNLEKIYQAEGAIRDLGKDETSSQQCEVNDRPKPQSQEPSPDFGRTRSDLEDLARRPQRHDPIQTERRSQPGASSRPNREDRTDRNQPDRDLRTNQRHRTTGDLHPEDTQNRPKPNLDQTRPTEQTDSSNPDFAAIQAGFIELSNQVRDRAVETAASHQGLDRDWSIDMFDANVSSNNLDASRHQEQTRGANPAGTSSSRAISNPTEGGRGGSSKTQKTESQKVKPLKKPQLTIRPRTDRDVTPTVGELRETYRRKSTFGDKMGLDEIEKIAIELNRIYQQIHPDREKAPDDFKHPDVWIDSKLLEVSIPVTIDVDPESKSQKRERDQDYGMSM
jgi:MobA/MobL family